MADPLYVQIYLICNPKFETPQPILQYCRLKKWENYSCGSRLDTDQTNRTVCSQHRLRTPNKFFFFKHIPNDLSNWADWTKKLWGNFCSTKYQHKWASQVHDFALISHFFFTNAIVFTHFKEISVLVLSHVRKEFGLGEEFFFCFRIHPKALSMGFMHFKYFFFLNRKVNHMLRK